MALRRLPRPLARRPLRLQITAAFASVTAVVLAIAGVLIFLEFSAGFDRRTDIELKEREATIARLATEERDAAGVIALAGEAYVQVYHADGTVLASSRLLRRGRLLEPADVRRAARAPIAGNHQVPGSDDGARVRAFAIASGRVTAIGEPLEERTEELHGLAVILGITLPAALLLASFAGYFVARGALRPVEDMRAQASTIGAGDRSQRLPVPGTRDELDRLALTLNALLDRLDDALDRERRFVGDASHELRTPISILRTRVEVARRGEQDPAVLQAVLEDTHGDALRLSRLADDLLVLARADQSEIPLRPGLMDVHDLLEATVRRHDVALGAGRIVIGQGLLGGAVALGDLDRTAQAIDNFVANALRHSTGPVELGARLDGEHVAITVRDHGDGIPDDFIDRAFERFSQARPDPSGTGLGLAITRALARAQGGDATVANHPGGGAIGTLTVPLA